MKFKKWLVIIFLLCGLIKFGTVNSYAAPNLNKPKLKTAKETSYNRIKIVWEKNKKASGYIIYRNGSVLVNIKNGKQTSFTDKNVQIGKAYKYSIKAYRTYKSKRLYSEESNRITCKTSLKTPQLSKISFWRSGAPFATGVEYGVTWNKIKGADGYQVETKEYDWKGNDGTSFYKYTKNPKASIQFSDIYKFGFRARAYRIVNGTYVYSAYSKWKWKIMY